GDLREIDSNLPPVTASAWPSIYTGLEPSEHGIMDFLFLDKNYTKQLIYYDTQRSVPFWDTLAQQGLKSLVITPAMVLKKSSHKGVDMVTGWPLQPRYSSLELERAAKKFGFEGEPDIGMDLEKRAMSIEKASKLYH